MSTSLATARDVFSRAREHNITDLAAAIAFRTAVALVPLAVVVATAAALTTTLLDVRDPAERLVESLDEGLPDGMAATLSREAARLFASPSGLSLALGLLAALWAGALAMNTTVKALNVIHETEHQRDGARKWAVVLALTAVSGLLFVVAFVGFFALDVFGAAIASTAGLGEGNAWILTGLRYPAAFLAVVAGAAMLYSVAPARPRDARWVTVGGITFALAWLAGTFGFLFYLQRLGGYDAAYGTLGVFVLLLAWLYITSLAFLVGGEIDAAFARRRGEARANLKPDEAPSADYPVARGLSRHR
jgi:membrane protein